MVKWNTFLANSSTYLRDIRKNRKKKSSHIYYHIHNSRQRHFSENINMKNVEFMLNEINPWYDYICLGGKCKFVFYFRWFSVYSRAFHMNALIPLSYEEWHYVKKICMFGLARKKLSSGSSRGVLGSRQRNGKKQLKYTLNS